MFVLKCHGGFQRTCILKQPWGPTDEVFQQNLFCSNVNCVLKVNANEVFPDQDVVE